MSSSGGRRVLILYGGRSSEHEISCLSARSILDSIDRDRYEIVPVGVTRTGRWLLTDGAITADAGQLPHVKDEGRTVALVRGKQGPTLVRFGDDRYDDLGTIDVVFPVLHGPYGEDGTVQGLLATVGVPYVGADVTASSVGIDKRAMKDAFTAWDLPQVDHVSISRKRWDSERETVVAEVAERLDFPIFVKPARQGSSIGISKVADASGIGDAADSAFAFDHGVIFEQGIEKGRELEVGVLGNDDIRVAGPGEIIPSHEFYDYDAKYLDDSQLVVPADVPAEVAEELHALARKAFRAIGCRGMARVDFFLGPDGTIYVNEINTIPGFTSASMYPRMWEAQGLSFGALVSELLELAVSAAEADDAVS